MAAIIESELGVDVTLTSGDRGEFTLWLDGRKVFDIHDGPDYDFPDEATVLRVIRTPA